MRVSDRGRRTWARAEALAAGAWLALMAATVAAADPPRGWLALLFAAAAVLAGSWLARTARVPGPRWGRAVVPLVLLLGLPAALLANVPSLSRMKAVAALGLEGWRGNAATRPTPREPGVPPPPPWPGPWAGPDAVIFLGDSLTSRWRTDGREAWDRHFAPRGACNLGVGEERVEHILWRVENGALDGPPAAAVVVLAGTNNLGRNTPDQVAEGVSVLLADVRAKQPAAAVVLLALLPRGKAAGSRERVWAAAVNARLAADDHGPGVRYLDAGAVLLDSDGTLSDAVSPDGLHLSAEGYRRLGPEVNAALPPPASLSAK